MTLYEILISTVAGVNLLLTLNNMRSNSCKAADERVNDLEDSLRKQLKEHEATLNRLAARAELSITHEHLSEVYGDLKGISEQVHQLVGQHEQMNQNLRLLLARLVRE